MQGFGYRILPNHDPSINQSFVVIPEGPSFSSGGLYPNFMMSKKSSKKHKHKKSKHRHRHYEGQYGQFGVPVLSPEFLSPEFPMPVLGYNYGYGNLNNDPIKVASTLIDVATKAGLNINDIKYDVATAVAGITGTSSGSPAITAIITATTSTAVTAAEATGIPTNYLEALKKAINDAARAPVMPGIPGMPYGMLPGLVNPINPTPYPVLSPRFSNVRHLTVPDNDPELRRKVVKHFYKELKEKYFIDKFNKFFQYIIIENDEPRLVKTYEEYKKNENNFTDSNKKIKFITENIFSKYDLEVLISKLIAKYGMLNSDDENNMHWYNSKNRYAGLIKKAMYKKIKYRLEKKVDF